MAKANLQSLIDGILCGLSGMKPPVSIVQQLEPVAYLYNGVQLPKLPQWDKTQYPYAYIYQKGTFSIYGDNYVLALTSLPLVRSGLNVKNEDTAMLKYTYIIDQSEDVEWVDNGASIGSANLAQSIANPIWANYDIMRDDDSVYLAASEPVPVYEEVAL